MNTSFLLVRPKDRTEPDTGASPGRSFSEKNVRKLTGAEVAKSSTLPGFVPSSTRGFQKTSGVKIEPNRMEKVSYV